MGFRAVMEFDIRAEIEAMINVIDCNHHESELIRTVILASGFNAESLRSAKKIVRSEVARRIDSYAYTLGIKSVH